MTAAAKRSREPKRTMPGPVSDTPENIMRAIVNTPPQAGTNGATCQTMTDHDRKVQEAEQARDDARDAWLEAGKRVRELRTACAHPFEIAAAIKERDWLLEESGKAMDAYGKAIWARDAEQSHGSESQFP